MKRRSKRSERPLKLLGGAQLRIAEKYHHGSAVSVFLWFLTLYFSLFCSALMNWISLLKPSGCALFLSEGNPNAANWNTLLSVKTAVIFYSSHFWLDEDGVVVYTNCAVKDILGPKKPPAHAQGPYVISGNNRYIFLPFALWFFWLDISREILEEMPKDDPDRRYFEDFLMSVYWFPNPNDPEQADMIRGLAYVENVIRDLKIEISSHEMLANVRREASKNRTQKPDITGIFSFLCF